MLPLFHARTKFQIDNYLKRPSHGALLTGERGVGKYYIAKWLASQLSDEHITLTPPEDKTVISIDQIRELYALTKTGSSLTIIIKDAHIMRTEAQNAFLKLLEEPPKNTFFILTADSADSLLETIRSRCQQLEIITPSKKDLLDFASLMQTSVDPSQQKAFIHSTTGLPGLFLGLLESDSEAEAHKVLLSEVKLFYSGTPYERHALCVSHNYQKDWALQLLSIVGAIISSLLRQISQSDASIDRLSTQAEILQTTTRSIEKYNANVKIQLTQLAEKL